MLDKFELVFLKICDIILVWGSLSCFHFHCNSVNLEVFERHLVLCNFGLFGKFWEALFGVTCVCLTLI